MDTEEFTSGRIEIIVDNVFIFRVLLNEQIFGLRFYFRMGELKTMEFFWRPVFVSEENGT